MIYGKRIVALCIPRIHEASNHDLIASLNTHLRSHDSRLMVFSTPSELFWHTIDEQGEKAVFGLINYDITDVIVIQDEAIKDKDTVRDIIAKAQGHNIPVIVIGSEYPGCHNIGFDYAAGFAKVVRHVLADHGVTDLHMIAGTKGNPFSEERIAVVREAAAELGVPFCDEDISYGDFWSAPTEKAVEALFTRRRRLPQAIICANDSMAITTANVLKRHGRRVPEDVIVTGFDGVHEVKYSVPQITTCLCSFEHLAETISDTAFRLMDGKDVPARILVVPELQASESCGCQKGSSINASTELTFINNTFYRYQSEEEHMFRMISRMLECGSFPQIADILDKYDFYDLVIALNPECTDYSANPLEQRGAPAIGEIVKVIYNTDFPMHGRIDDMRTSDLHPNLYDALTQHDDPLIFFSLSYMGVAMGYICFNYHDYDIQNYYKASQTVNTLSTAFGAFRTIQYQHYLSKKIEEMYRCDGLTHLLNRTALKNSYQELLTETDGQMTVVLADLDGLKHINDTFGHDDGDFAICAVADALRSSCPENALCIRWGGDEMVAVIPASVEPDIIYKGIDKYLTALNERSGRPFRISASVGVKTFDITVNSDFEEMVRATDQLMYDDKNRKKQRRTNKK